MDIGTELSNISSDLHALANAIHERHINRDIATLRARALANTLINLKWFIDRNLEVRPNEIQTETH
jgi:hypothetical protein